MERFRRAVGVGVGGLLEACLLVEPNPDFDHSGGGDSEVAADASGSTTGSDATTDSGSMAECGDWWDLAWSHRAEVTISGALTTEPLVSFPIAVSITDPAVLTRARADGRDFVFVGSDGERLPHELDTHDGARSIAWVGIPELTPGLDTTLHLYFGNPDAVETQAPAAVWRSDFVGVWHLDDASDVGVGATRDSSGFEHHATSSPGGAPTVVAGVIGSGLSFSGDDLEVESTPTLQLAEALTISGWVALREDFDIDTTEVHVLLRKGDESPSDYQIAFKGGYTHAMLAASDNEGFVGTGRVELDVHHHVALTWDGAQARLFLDGESDGTFSADVAIGMDTRSLFIGGRPDGPSGRDGLSGELDEVQLSRVARSSAWIRASYDNQRDPAAFVRVSPPRARPPC